MQWTVSLEKITYYWSILQSEADFASSEWAKSFWAWMTWPCSKSSILKCLKATLLQVYDNHIHIWLDESKVTFVKWENRAETFLEGCRSSWINFDVSKEQAIPGFKQKCSHYLFTINRYVGNVLDSVLWQMVSLTSVTRLGDFWKVLVTNVLLKVAKLYDDLFGPK